MGKVSNLLLATSILTSLTIGTSTAQALEKVDVQQEETQPDLQVSNNNEQVINNNETEQSQSPKLKLKTSSEEEPKQEEPNQEVATSSDTEEVKTDSKKEETEKQNEQSKQKVEKSSKKVDILDTLKKEDATPLKTMYLKVNFSEIEQMLGSEAPKDVTIKIKNSKGAVIGTGKALSSKQDEFGDTKVKVSLKSPIKYNDKVSITVESSNKTFKGVSIKTVDTITAEENEYLVKNKKYTSLTIDASVYDEKMGLSENFTKYAKYQLYGSKVSPLNMVIEADNSSSIINVIYKGKGLANETIELNGKKYTTNKYGVI